jgi:hypothetical protein
VNAKKRTIFLHFLILIFEYLGLTSVSSPRIWLLAIGYWLLALAFGYWRYAIGLSP